MPKPNPYIDFLVEQFEPLGEISARRLFGGHGVYCNGTIFAIVASGAVYLKADDVNIPLFEARGLKAFQPFEDQPGTMRYYEAPPEIFEDTDAMKEWVGGAIGAAERAKKPKKRAR
jgi:DNA transformation protein